MIHIIPRVIWWGKWLQNVFIRMKDGNARTHFTRWSGRRWDSEPNIDAMGMRGVVHIHNIYRGRLRTSGLRLHWCWDRISTRNVRDSLVYIRGKWNILHYSWSHGSRKVNNLHGILIVFDIRRANLCDRHSVLLIKFIRLNGEVLYYRGWLLSGRGIQLSNNLKGIGKLW